MNDTELDKVFAGESIRFNWKTHIRFADSGGRFKFDFSAKGSFMSRSEDGFKAEAHLLGGLFKVEAGSDSHHESSPSSSGHPGPVTVSVNSNYGPSEQSGGFGSSNGNHVNFSVSKEGSEGPGGEIKLTFGGNDHSGGKSIVSFSGANVDSKIAVDIALISSAISPTNGIGSALKGIVTRTVRRSLCLGCP